MARSARVTSIEAISRFKVSLQKFEFAVQEALATLRMESERGIAWVENDRAAYWPRQVKLAGERLNEARNNLQRAQLGSRPGEGRSCYQEKKDVERAKQRLIFAENKVRLTQEWCRRLHHEIDQFQGAVGRLGQMIDVDLASALATLEHAITALDRYAAQKSVPAAEPKDGLHKQVENSSDSHSTSPSEEDL